MYNPGGYQPPTYPPSYPSAGPPASGPVQSMNVGPTTHTSSTNVVINQPTGGGGGGGRNVHMIKARPWNAGLFGCCDDIGTCFAAWCCPYCYLMYLSNLMEEDCFLPICVHYALPALRLKLRASENIQGSILKDCCAAHCCPLCVMCQIRREKNAITQIQSKALQYGG